MKGILPRILIIIPAYNEEDNIVAVVENLKKNFSNYDYIVVNDGSIDNTAGLCREHCYCMLDLPINLGLAGAFQAGMKYAMYRGYDYAIQYDGDGQHDPQYIAGMLEKAERENLDIVIGSRFVTVRKPFNARMIGNRIITACIKITTGKNIGDPTSGMRMFNIRMIKKLATTINCGPEPDTVAYLMRCGARVSEYQVTMHERTAGESYLNWSRSIKYMFHMCSSILVVQWFRKKGL